MSSLLCQAALVMRNWAVSLMLIDLEFALG